jgi:hypothetical protein
MPAGPLEHHVPAALLKRLGDITVSFAMLEKQIQFLAWVLLGDAEKQRVGNIITAELSFQALCDLVRNLYREQFGEGDGFEELLELMKRARRLEEGRNRLTHSFWTPSFSGADGAKVEDVARRVKTTAKGKRGLASDDENVDEPGLAEVAGAFKQLAGEVMAFSVRLSIED